MGRGWDSLSDRRDHGAHVAALEIGGWTATRGPTSSCGAQEREQLLRVANEQRFAELPPARIVPMLADEGTYLASESSFNRVLRAHGQGSSSKANEDAPGKRPPSTHVATAPRMLWSWDLTFLPTTAIGHWLYLYVILDVFSRKIVGWEVHERDSSDHAVDLVRRTALAEGIHALDEKPVLHGDNGSTVKATTVLAMLHWLGIKASHSSPRVSDDNSFIEAFFFAQPSIGRSSRARGLSTWTRRAVGSVTSSVQPAFILPHLNMCLIDQGFPVLHLVSQPHDGVFWRVSQVPALCQIASRREKTPTDRRKVDGQRPVPLGQPRVAQCEGSPRESGPLGLD
jgi:transposase InsO family protein